MARDEDMTNNQPLLLRCVQDCDKTCKDYDAALTRILQSKIRQIKWSMSQPELKDIGSRLEANKSTLQLCMTTIR